MLLIDRTEEQRTSFHDRINAKFEENWRLFLVEFDRNPEAFGDTKEDGPATQEFDFGTILAQDEAILLPPRPKKQYVRPGWTRRTVLPETGFSKAQMRGIKLRKWFEDRGDGPVARPYREPEPPYRPAKRPEQLPDTPKIIRARERRRGWELENRKIKWKYKFPLYDISC